MILNEERDPIELLVDESADVFAWEELAKRYYLYQKNSKGRMCRLSRRKMVKLFDPGNINWERNVSYFMRFHDLYICNDNESFWKVEYHEGHIWAINPLADWDAKKRIYTMPQYAK